MRRIALFAAILIAGASTAALAAEQKVTIIGDDGSTVVAPVPAGCTAVHQSEVVCKTATALSVTVLFERKKDNVKHPCDVLVSMRKKFGIKVLRGSGPCYIREISADRFGVGYDPNR